MSASTGQKSEWIVILPDKQGALAQRMSVRPQHFEALKTAATSGFWTMGGATLSTPPQEGQPLQITGSVMMALAESKEEVEKALKEDVYSTAGVWDWEKVQIFPFRSAFRVGKDM